MSKSRPSKRTNKKSKPTKIDRFKLRKSRLRRQAHKLFDEATKLGGFLDAGRAPRTSDVEIAVCFADVRGFTEYVQRLQRRSQDNKVRQFLQDYLAIYPKALYMTMANLARPLSPEERRTILPEVQKMIVPTAYKNLGDGMMIVWELQGASSTLAWARTTQSIWEFVDNVAVLFNRMTQDLTPPEIDSYSQDVTALRLGFGLAKGHAWRLDFANGQVPDYAGSVVNLAARLQALARPEGIIAEQSFSAGFFELIVKPNAKGMHVGRMVEVVGVRGLDDRHTLWLSDDVDSPELEQMISRAKHDGHREPK